MHEPTLSQVNITHQHYLSTPNSPIFDHITLKLTMSEEISGVFTMTTEIRLKSTILNYWLFSVLHCFCQMLAYQRPWCSDELEWDTLVALMSIMTTLIRSMSHLIASILNRSLLLEFITPFILNNWIHYSEWHLYWQQNITYLLLTFYNSLLKILFFIF